MTKQVEVQIKWYSLKIQTLVTRVGKNINTSRVKRFLSKCVIFAYMCRFLKTSKKGIHFTQNNSWSKIIFKLERARKMISRYISVYLCFVTLKKEWFIVKRIIIQWLYSFFSILTRFAPGNEKYILSLTLTRLICLHVAMVHLLKWWS